MSYVITPSRPAHIQSTCLVQVEALLDDVQLHQFEVTLLIVLWCKLVETMHIFIIQQNNIYRLSSDLPQSGPDSPCEGGTRPGSDAASSPVALRCLKAVR